MVCFLLVLITGCDRPGIGADRPAGGDGGRATAMEPAWQEVALPVPPGPAGRPVLRDAAACAGRLVPGRGGCRRRRGDPSGGLVQRGRCQLDPGADRGRTFYGRQHVLYAAACVPGPRPGRPAVGWRRWAPRTAGCTAIRVPGPGYATVPARCGRCRRRSSCSAGRARSTWPGWRPVAAGLVDRGCSGRRCGGLDLPGRGLGSRWWRAHRSWPVTRGGGRRRTTRSPCRRAGWWWVAAAGRGYRAGAAGLDLGGRAGPGGGRPCRWWTGGGRRNG